MSRGTYGANQERRLKRFLEDKGYEVCRSTRSQGTFDLIAFRSRKSTTGLKERSFDKLFIQIKTGTWPGRTEMKRIRRYARASRLEENTKILVIRFDRESRLARVHQVYGWEKNKKTDWKRVDTWLVPSRRKNKNE